jgi:hypothetical protein
VPASGVSLDGKGKSGYEDIRGFAVVALILVD